MWAYWNSVRLDHRDHIAQLLPGAPPLYVRAQNNGGQLQARRVVDLAHDRSFLALIHTHLLEPHVLRPILLAYLEFFQIHYPMAPPHHRLDIATSQQHTNAMNQVITTYASATATPAEAALVDIAQRVKGLM
jgi:hypothetical protein